MAEIKIYAKPSNLFRYRPLGKKIDQEMDALLGGYIYCPAFSEMNDPMEGAFNYSERFTSSPGGEKSKIRVQDALSKMGIASMSEVHDHEPMWAHYADQFKGVCIQYSLNRLLKGLDNNIVMTRMMYSEKEPVLLFDGSTSMERARLCLSSKTVRWASEREWRIFLSERGCARYNGEQAATKIFMGARISVADEQRIMNVGRQLGIAVSKMSIKAYSIAFKQVLSARK